MLHPFDVDSISCKQDLHCPIIVPLILDGETELKLFVTGAGGFIGSAVANYLSGIGFDIIEHVRSVDGDLTKDSIPNSVNAIVNCIGKLGLPGVDHSQLTHSNVAVPSLLAEVCSKREIHLIHLSTPGISGLHADMKEDNPADPWGDYERSKYQGESDLFKHTIWKSGYLTVLRPDFVYGPGDLHKLPFFRQVSKGWLPLIGLKACMIRPTFVLDVCTAVENSLPGKCLNGGLYNIGGPDVTSVKEFGTLIAGALERHLVTFTLPKFLYVMALHMGPLKPGSLTYSRVRLFSEDHYVSIRKAADAGFLPCISLREGILETVNWYRREKLL